MDNAVHRFIIYQYGKVGSTSVAATLNALEGIEAHQTHFLGEKAFSEIFQRLVSPQSQQHFFDHASGQLVDNLRVYRYFLRRELDPEPLTIISLAREPFDWFRSALSQDVEEHLRLLKEVLQQWEQAFEDDADALGAGLQFLFNRLIAAINHFGDLDTMRDADRYKVLYEVIEHRSPEDFRIFMYFVNIFMRPHVWFRNHFHEVFDFNISAMDVMPVGGLRRAEDWGHIYLLNYENLQAEFSAVMAELGIDAEGTLVRENVSEEKLFSNEISDAFATDVAISLGRLCHSEDTRLLGYPPKS